MDLIILVVILVLIGFAVYILTERVPMPPYWKSTIQIVSLLLIILYLIVRFSPGIPNVLPK